MNLRRVVIGIDFGEPATAAARWLVRQFAGDAGVMLVHSIDIPESRSFLQGRLPPAELLVELAREGADRRLRELGKSLNTQHISTHVGVGHPADEIARVAQDFNADLVVVAKQGERPGGPNRLGSTAEKLAWGSPIPVLLATGMRDAQPRKLLAAVDEDDVAPWVLLWARGLSERFDATVMALNVVSLSVLSHVLSMAAVGAGGGDLDMRQVQEEFREDTDRWLRRLLKSGLHPERTDCEVAFGHPAQEILGAAERLGSDLIILGSRRPGPVRRALLGSIAGEVLRYATRPVLVVKEPQDLPVEPKLEE